MSIELNLGRIGSFFSDRLIVESSVRQGHVAVRVANSWWDWCLRIIAWIYTPSCYSDENRRTVSCFKTYLVDQLGAERLQRISTRYKVDLDAMERIGSPLLSRDVAKIKTGIEDVKIEDIEGAIAAAKDSAQCTRSIQSDPRLRSILQGVSNTEELNPPNFAFVYGALKKPLSAEVSVPPIEIIKGGRPTEWLASYFFDRFLADRERLILQRENIRDHFETFIHHFCVRIMRRELDVGMLVPAPRDSRGSPQFYRVGGKLITADGMVSYWLIPATKRSELEPIRFYRGTAARFSEIDSASSVINDMEPTIGESAWKSGKIYASAIKTYLPTTPQLAGHSLGSTLSQLDLIDNSDIRIAYLYNGPGVSESQLEAFNGRMCKWGSRVVKLIIRDAHKDRFSAAGRIHLGYKAPRDKVSIDYRKYFASRKMGHAGRVHTTVWALEDRIYGMEGGHNTQALDALFHHKDLSSWTVLAREMFGPCLGSIIRLVRDIFRWCFGSRAIEQRGLQVGRFEGGSWFWGGGHWTVRHIRPTPS